MPAVIRPTGLRRRSPETHRKLCAERPYSLALLPIVTVFQPVYRIHDQPQWGCCVGEALSAGAEARLKRALSGVKLWIDARRRQGDLANANTGTWGDIGIQSMVQRGLSPYEPGEETWSTAKVTQMPDLSDELAADDTRVPVANEHRTIVPGSACLQSVCDALQRGFDIVNGDGLRDPYFSLGLDDIADESCLNGSDNGHEQRVIAYVAPNDTRFPANQRGNAIYQNSWSEAFGGYTLPCTVTLTDGTVLEKGHVIRGCVMVKGACLANAWDRDALSLEGVQ
jgi:hypothetical protein